MKPAPFDYHAPETVEDCLSVLAQHGDEAKILAGGQSLVPMLALRLARPEVLVDVNRVRELAAVRRENGSLVVGATTRHATLESDPEIAAASPLLARVAPHIGHFQIRNRGTLGGSLAHADPAAELPAVVRVLDAEIEVAGPSGIRRIAAADFFETVFTTSLEPDELVTAVRFPVWGAGSGFAVEEVARRHGDFAIVGALAAVQVHDGRLSQGRHRAHRDGQRAGARRSGGAGAQRRRRRGPGPRPTQGCRRWPTSSRRPTCTPARSTGSGSVRPSSPGPSPTPSRRPPVPEVSTSGQLPTVEVGLTVNGQARRVRVEPRKTLSDTLREDLAAHRHAHSLRARGLRIVHDPAGRRGRALVSHVRGPGRGRAGHHGGGSGVRRHGAHAGAAAPSASVTACSAASARRGS